MLLLKRLRPMLAIKFGWMPCLWTLMLWLTLMSTKAVFGSRKSISGKYSRKIFHFPEMLFSGKENVFMCLVVFQKIFQKIFSGVWKMLQGKRQNQKNKHSTQIDTRDRLASTAIDGVRRREGEIAIDGTISRSVDRNRRGASRDRDRRRGRRTGAREALRR